MSHYFSEHADLADDKKELSYRFRGRDFSFVSNSGVFSKDHIDEASELLLEASHDDIDALKSTNLERYRLLTQGQALDVGTGYGVLAIVLKRLYPDTTWTMIDVNERALALAKENLELNRVFGAELIKSDGFTALDRTFSLMVSNPPIRIGKKALYKILLDMAEHLEVGGRTYLVIGKKQGAKSAITYLQTLYVSVEVIAKKKGFYVIRCEKN